MAETQYTYSQIEPGVSGYRNETASRCILDKYAAWTAVITGTDAYLSVYGILDYPFQVFVDDDAAVNPTIASDEIALFTGKADTAHIVTIRMHSAFTNNNGILLNTTYALRVIGDAPDMTPLPFSFVSLSTFPGLNSQPTVDSVGGDFFPTDKRVGSNTASTGQIVIRVALDSLWVFTRAESVWYSIDKGTPVEVTLSGFPDSNQSPKKIASGLDGNEHEIYIWPGEASLAAGIQAVLPVLNNAPATLLSVVAKTSVYFYGDSIVYGTAGGSPGQIDAFIVALSNNYIVAKMGVNGRTISELAADIPDYFDESIIPDYAVNCIGRNDVSGSTYETDYAACISAFLAEGVLNVICRGQLPGTDASGAIATKKTNVENAITAVGDSGVVFMDTTSWTECDTVDGVHPSVAGYATVAGDEGTALILLIEGVPTYEISGVTYDKNGSILIGCTVYLFKFTDGVPAYVELTTSDGITGAYSFELEDNDASYMIVAHKAGTPNLYDVTDKNLQPVEV